MTLRASLRLLCIAALLGIAPLSLSAASRPEPDRARLAGAPAPALIGVVSRITHGAAGPFDLRIDATQPIGGDVSIEPRQRGSGHAVVFRFDSPLLSPGTLTLTGDTGAVIAGGAAAALGMEVTVTLPPLADNTRVRVALNNVNGAGLNVAAALGLLLGDVTGVGEVAAASLSAIRSRAGQPVDTGNFQFDLNASGIVTAADIAAVRSRRGAVLSPPPRTPWPAFARNPQHTAVSTVASQPLTRLRWNTPVDLAPQYSGSVLFAHYGSPLVTARNTVLLPVKTGAAGGFRLEARSAASGGLIWSASSDYILPEHNWLPSYNLTLTPANRVYAPGAGGKLYYRDNPDSPAGAMQSVVFYGAATYAAAPASYDATVFINTPITSDAQGNLFFGFAVTGANPANLSSGIARVAPDGSATWIDAAALMGTAFARSIMNSAPALSLDQGTLYIALRTAATASGVQTGYLVALDSVTLAHKSRVRLIDPRTGIDATVTDNGTSSPTIGPDGDVYFGMLGTAGSGHASRGWMLHYDATLALTKLPGAFGWDNTPSIVPASMVPSYTGPSSYLLMTKYNSYSDGQHRIAILDPNQFQIDANSGMSVMLEIFTMLSVTPTVFNPSFLTEWCINTAAVDPLTRSVLVNNEDGYLYRWDLVTNQLSERIQLNSGVGQAYTSTVIGPDGAVYAVNNAVLFSVGR